LLEKLESAALAQRGFRQPTPCPMKILPPSPISPAVKIAIRYLVRALGSETLARPLFVSEIPIKKPKYDQKITLPARGRLLG
jgi:hypothetical protein